MRFIATPFASPLAGVVLGAVVEIAVSLAFAPQIAQAAGDGGSCRVVQVDMVPTADLQIVAWVEDSAGNYVDTVYLTRLVGTYGLGNRPGMMDFNTAWHWPYGRRNSTFPVWANRHGMQWPQLVFQNDDDRNLSHPLGQSSVESFYCRPLRESDPGWDTQTCASTIYTDKGAFSETEVSLYPPRSDVGRVDNVDDMAVGEFRNMNPFDEISGATPTGGEPFSTSWAIKQDLPDGDYVMWVEVAKEIDPNGTYDFPSPVGIPWSEYGIAYRGQPSVVYRADFTIGAQDSVGISTDYVGYGDPDGLTGMLFEPDATITTGVSGSGGSRLLLVDDGGEMYRVRVSSRPTVDNGAPGAATEVDVVGISSSDMTVAFVAPGDDGDVGIVAGYDIRMLVGEPLTMDNWDQAMPIGTVVRPEEPGTEQSFTLTNLQARTNYYIGIRGVDECRNAGELVVVHALTPEIEAGKVDACFVATAAYGSFMQGDVTLLRSFRDKYLRSTVTGELFVEAYYTFGPALAQLIAPSDTARRAARTGLGPLVELIRDLAH